MRQDLAASFLPSTHAIVPVSHPTPPHPRSPPADLADWLRQRGVLTVLVCGVATEYCVKATVIDSLAEGFATALLTDAGALGGGGLS